MANAIRRLLKGAGLIALLLYVCGAIALYMGQRELIFPGQHTAVAAEVPKVDGMQSFRVRTSGGDVDAWYLPPFNASAPFPAVVFGHGNGEVIDQWTSGLDEFRRWGMAVMLVEYPGYGRSGGGPSEEGVREAMVGAYDVLLSRPGIDARRIVGYGQSLGGGAICALASERPLAALILQSTFTTIRTFAQRYWMPSFLVRDPFDNEEIVRRFDGPIFLIHGRHDELIPTWQAEALASLARRGKLHLYDCGHYCWFPDRLPLLADMKQFLLANAVLSVRANVGQGHARAGGMDPPT